jgi:hypothetical protein
MAGCGWLSFMDRFTSGAYMDVRSRRPGLRMELPLRRRITERVLRRDLSEAEKHLCVPKTSSTSCDQAVLVDQASGAGLPSDAVPVEINRFGEGLQRRTGDHHGRTAGRATLLARAMDEILGTHTP